MGKDDKMYICLEAFSRTRGENYYMICSIRLSDLISELPKNAVPHLKLEKKFEGNESMGCGLYGSKIVFTGGKIKRNGFITFDFTTHKLSHNSFPFMRRGKVKPLVFELNKRLYVFDVSSCHHEGAFEYYSPCERRWYDLLLPHDAPVDRCFLKHGDDPENPRHNYSFLIFGNTCYFHIPPYENITFFHHPNYSHQTWMGFPRKHPFSGASTFYRQDGFFDSVVLSFDNGVVRAYRFCLQSGYPDDPIHLFKVEPSSQSNTNMSGYFADLQGGIFTLTAYDDVCIYLHTFKIYRTGEDGIIPMTIEWSILSEYRIKFSSLPLGHRMLSVVGCFPSSPNTQAIKSTDEVFGECMTRIAKRCDNDSRKLEIDGKLCTAPRGPRGDMVHYQKDDGPRLLVVVT